MKFVKIKDGVEWKGYLAVHETISGYECFICNDEPFTRIALTEEHLKDYQLGIPKFAFSEKDRRNWMTAEGEITVPDIAAKFSLIPAASGLKNEEDRIFFDDLEAVLIP